MLSLWPSPWQICLGFPVLFFYLSRTFRCLSSLSCLYRQQLNGWIQLRYVTQQHSTITLYPDELTTDKKSTRRIFCLGLKYPPFAFSFVNWCKSDVFTSNIVVLHYKMSQTVKIKVNRHTNIYWWNHFQLINLYSFLPVFQLFFYLLLLIVWDFLWCKAIIFKVKTSILHKFTGLKASGGYFIPG